MRRAELAAVAALALVAPACAPEPPLPRHVVVVSLDTVRADAVWPADGASPDMPRLAALCREALCFPRAYTPEPFTLPAHMTLLTGLGVGSHGVDRKTSVLRDSIPTLAGRLRDEGFRTVGLVTTEWLQAGFGFASGFDRYEQLPHGLTYAERVADAALAELREADAKGDRLFLFAHFFDAHSDFEAIEGNRIPYYSPPEDRTDIDESEVERLFCHPEWGCASSFLVEVDNGERPLEPRQLELLRDLYRRGTRALDRDIGRFLDRLRDDGLLDRSILIIVSDHGEEFREHGRLLHSQVYEETIRVPYLVRLPGGRAGGSRPETIVSLMDVAPTILDALDLLADGEASRFDGVSLRPLLDGTGEVADRRLLLRDKLYKDRYGLVGTDGKLVADLDERSFVIFDLAADPAESDGVAASRDEIRALSEALRSEAERSRGFGGERSDQVLDEKEIETLRALGYLVEAPRRRDDEVVG